MDLSSIAMTDFVYLLADWPVAKANELIRELDPSHVIVHRVDPDREEYYYLLTAEEALTRLSAHPESAILRQGLDLHEWGATPVADSASSAESTPQQCVILTDGRPTGFFDVFSLAPKGITRGGVSFGLTTERGTEGLEAERQLKAEFPEQVSLNDSASLLVYIGSVNLGGAGLPLSQPVGTVLDIVVQARRGFVLKGSADGKLAITDSEEGLPLQFSLQAVNVGPGEIRILAFQNGSPLGMIRLSPTVVEKLPQDAVQRIETREGALAPASVKLPDLSLLIEETQVNGQRAFLFRLNSADPSLNLNFTKFGPVVLQADPGKYFEEFYKDIEDYPLRDANDRAIAVQKLADKGSVLFSTLLPKEVKELLWSLKERITTAFVQSEEPWIPWELCKLFGEDGGKIVEGPFFCEAFAMTRWIPGIGLKPALKLKNIAVVVPSDSGLPYASLELDYLESLAAGGRTVTRIPARFVDLHKAFKSGEYDAWHFTGHGGYRSPDPNRSAMYLENKETFSPENLVGVAANLGRAKPLVFLNACQIGRGGMSLTDIGGWARQFLAAGAGGFVGAYWSIYDQPAFNFSEALYDGLLAGIPIGKAMREARLAVRAAGDPTWLAYTAFADPLATVQG